MSVRVLTHSHPVQLAPKKDAGNIHDTTHSFPLVEGPYATYSLPTSILWAASRMNLRAHQQTPRQNDIWKSAQGRAKSWPTAQTTSEYRYIRGGDQFQVLGATPCKDGTCLAEVRIKNCRSNGQTKQDLAVQHHQLCKQGQFLQVSCHLHPPLWLWSMDPACWHWEKDPGVEYLVPEETFPHLLLEAQDQWLGVEQNQLPCASCWSTRTSCGSTCLWHAPFRH